ncbi:MAG: hypothetical protein MZW92_03050 [Comamonadaceae bacterium]|nr:hypothetical protein [Comamonadaceae bacterium]
MTRGARVRRPRQLSPEAAALGRRQRRQSLLQTVRHAVQRPAVRPDQERALPARHRGRRSRREAGRGRRHRRQPRQGADLREHHRRARPLRDLPRRGERRLRRPAEARDQRRAPGHGPGDGAPAVGPPRRHRPQREALRARQGGLRPARPARASAPRSACLLENTYKDFVARRRPRSTPRGRSACAQLNAGAVRPARCEFGENVLAETNAFQLVIDDTGRPGRPAADGRRHGARTPPSRPGSDGKWVFTIQVPSMWPVPAVLRATATLRRAGLHRPTSCAATTATSPTTRTIVRKIAALRAEQRQAARATPTYADFVLEREHGQDARRRSTSFLTQLWTPALAEATAGGGRAAGHHRRATKAGFKLEPLGLVATTPRSCARRSYDLDEDALRALLQARQRARGRLRPVRQALRAEVHRAPRPAASTTPRSRSSRSRRPTAATLGILYMDFHPAARASAAAPGRAASGGRAYENGKRVRPIVHDRLQLHRARPADAPALLTHRRGRDPLPRVRPRPAHAASRSGALPGPQRGPRLRGAARRRSWRTGSSSPSC